MKGPFKLFTFLVLSLVATQSLAANLLDIYQQAMANDAVYQASQAEWLSAKQNIGITKAALLPFFDLQFAYTASRNHTEPPSRTTSSHVTQYALNLDQTVFNYQSWKLFREATASVKAQAANYSKAGQDLIIRTANAYFNVLKAQDLLRYTLAEERSLKRQLAQNQQRYKVGLIAITPVYQAQAQYDAVVAEEIKARNDLANAKEQLREITNRQYDSFAVLSSSLPLILPQPNAINEWVEVALLHNYSLLAAQYGVLAARENISAQEAGRFPTVVLQGKAGLQRNSNTAAFGGLTGNDKSRFTSLGVAVDFPVMQGGLINAKTNQAIYDYEKSSAELEQARRTVISQTRQNYLGVLAGIGRIKADKQAIVSASSSLKATEAGYVVGTQTMVDVLKVQSDLYNAQKQYAEDQYNYLLETLALKQAAGTLNISDLQKINTWLTEASHQNIIRKRVKQKTNPTNNPVQKSSPATAKPVPKITEAQFTQLEKDLLNMNPDHYTIQLVSDVSENHIIYFVNTHQLKAKTYCYSTKPKSGTTLYKLVIGDFVSRSKAQVALQKLPHSVQILKPWIRTFASVQQEIKEGRP